MKYVMYDGLPRRVREKKTSASGEEFYVLEPLDEYAQMQAPECSLCTELTDDQELKIRVREDASQLTLEELHRAHDIMRKRRLAEDTGAKRKRKATPKPKREKGKAVVTRSALEFLGISLDTTLNKDVIE